MKNLSKVISTVLMFIMVVSSVVFVNEASTTKNVKVKIDSKAISYKIKPVVKSGKVFVDAKVTAKALKAKYSYNKKKKQIVINKGTTKLIYKIGSKTVKVNSKKNKVKAPFLVKKKPFVEFGFLAKKLGYVDYSYNKKNGIVAVKTEKIVKPKIHIISDSTASNNFITTSAKRGWGQIIGNYINDKYAVNNIAKDGESSKSFYDANYNYLKESVNKGDYLLIQFGHNDQKYDMAHNTSATEPSSTQGSYKYYLLQFIKIAKSKGAIPIILSPVARGLFGSDGKTADTLGSFTKAAKELAEEQNVVYVPLNEKSIELYQLKGKDFVQQHFFVFDKDGGTEKDLSHFTLEGATEICKIIVDELKTKGEGMLK